MRFILKIYNIIILILFILSCVGGVIFLYFEYEQNNIMPDSLGDAVVPPITKEECLEKTKNMTDDELVGEINNLKAADEIISSTGKDRLGVVHEKMLDYLLCRVGYEKKEEIYNVTKNFVQESTIKDKNKKVELDKLDEIYGFPWNIYLSDKLLQWHTNIAMGEIISLCKVIDPDNDLASIEVSLKKFQETKQIPMIFTEEVNLFDKIKRICETFDKYAKNIPLSIKTELNVWENNQEALRNQMVARSAVTFYIGGKDLALEVCNSVSGVDEELRSLCAKNISFWVDLKRCKRYSYGGTEDCEIADECKTIRQEIEEFICKVD